MNTEQILELTTKLQSWRPDSMTLSLIKGMAANGIPFCEKCADWHFANEEHSAVFLNGKWIDLSDD